MVQQDLRSTLDLAESVKPQNRSVTFTRARAFPMLLLSAKYVSTSENADATRQNRQINFGFPLESFVTWDQQLLDLNPLLPHHSRELPLGA